jgi:hypothetical protein
MMAHQPQKHAIPAALACGLLEDGGRVLFLCRKNAIGIETVELPCVILQKGENPVARLTEEFVRQTGIDAHVGEILFEKKHNIGTRKRKAFIPALVFGVAAKSAAARPASEFFGYRWISAKDLMKFKVAKVCEWLR